MAQSDQTVQNATFPAVRADINDNFAALFSQSSGPSAPAVTVAYQPWIDTSASPAVWNIRNGTNTGWVTIGTLDLAVGSFAVGGVTPIANGGTGQVTAAAAINALLPSQTGNSGKSLTTDGTVVSWGAIVAGASLQVFTSSTTYTPTSGKTSFLVFATGGGGGSGGLATGGNSGGGGGGGTAMRLYTAAEMGANAVVTIGAAGNNGNGSGSDGGNGGSTSFNPAGTGVTITGAGGNGSPGSVTGAGPGANGGGTTNSELSIVGSRGTVSTASGGGFGGSGGTSLWGRSGANGATGAGSTAGNTGSVGNVVVLEW